MGDTHRSAGFFVAGESGASHGVFFREELADLGIDARRRRKLLRDGELITPRKDWYATPVHDAKVAAAVRAGGVLACVSALQRYGFWVPPGYSDEHVRSGRWADRASCTAYSPIPAGRTAVDSIIVALECAARCMAAEDWIAVCDSVQQGLGVSADRIRAEMGRLPACAEALLDKTDHRSQSGTESIARVRLRALHFKVVVQPQITEVARADLRIGRLIIECDGAQFHTDKTNYQNDRLRDRKSTIGNWLTFRLTYDDVLFGWDGVVEDIRAITRPGRHRGRASGMTTAP